MGDGENTLAGFAEALRLGADGVELDVRRTADGALAVHHDPVIPGRGPLAELRARDLPPHVPLLEEALDECAAGVVNVEIKNAPHEAGFDPDELVAWDVAGVVASAPGAIIVSAFTAATLDAVVTSDPEVPVGLLTLPGFDLQAAVALAVERGYRALHPHHGTLTAEAVRSMHDAGLAVHVWTVNEPARAAELASWGVESVITDRVADVVGAVDATAPAPAE